VGARRWGSVPPTITSVVAQPGGSISLAVTGTPRSVCTLETTTNFLPATWLPLVMNNLDTNGVAQFIDSQASVFPQRFTGSGWRLDPPNCLCQRPGP
jgi:hypothetical protein